MRIRALALVSSGLDSMLAAKIVRDQGIEVIGLNCLFRFDPARTDDQESPIHELFEPLGIPVLIRDITDDFLEMVLDPPHGYGKGVNPCIDCKIFMLRYAKNLLDELDARFIVTGEVVGQRPMSQMKPTLFHIEKEAGLKGLILRPLTAKCLPPSLAEEAGWIDREKLFDINGRSRKPQIEIAESLGIRRFNQPAGGCILTDPNYAKRAKMLFQKKEKSSITPDDMRLLRLGRHFWTDRGVHVVVGRDEADNHFLESFREGRWAFEAADFEGPLVLAGNIHDVADMEIVAAITARYCGRKKADVFRIQYTSPQMSGEVTVAPIEESMLSAWRV
jgi:tRNA-specific 2-thiouridylase